MANFNKILLSGSTNGRPIAIIDTAATGTLIHTSLSGSTQYDEVYVWAHNYGTATTTARLTVEFGGTSGTDQIHYDMYGGDHLLIVPGTPFNGSVAVRAFATASTIFRVYGYANRITT